MDAFARELEGTDVVIYEDNEAARNGLLSGYSAEAHNSAIIGNVWLRAMLGGVGLWVERVHSHSNPADSLSRLDFSLAEKLEWVRVTPTLPRTLQQSPESWATQMQAGSG